MTQLEQQTMDAGNLQRSVSAALRESGRPELRRLSVRISGRCAIIEGRVPTYYARQIAQSLARNIQGVESIRDCIIVQSPAPLQPR